MEETTEDKSEEKQPIFPVSADGKKSVIIFAVSILLIVGLTFLMRAIALIDIYAVRYCLTLLLIVSYTAVAVVAMFLTGQQKLLLPTKNKLWLQILIGVGIAAVLCFFIGVLPILCGTSLCGSHTDMSAGQILL